MGNQRHVDILVHDGVAIWNLWRADEPAIHPDVREIRLTEARLHHANLSRTNLSGADLTESHLHTANLAGADLSMAKLYHANLSGADLSRASLIHADLTGVNLHQANLSGANLSGANLGHAQLHHANLSGAILTGANLSGADLRGASCVETNFSWATLTDCSVYGISAWDVNLDGAVQADLDITVHSEKGRITVDNLEVAQFIYLLLHNQSVRSVLDTIASKVVLILGHFAERGNLLDTLRDALRRHPSSYIPVLFDFQPQSATPVLEMGRALARLARFVIADLTDPRMMRAELSAIMPKAPTVPVVPIYHNADVQRLLASLPAPAGASVEGQSHMHWFGKPRNYRSQHSGRGV